MQRIVGGNVGIRSRKMCSVPQCSSHSSEISLHKFSLDPKSVKKWQIIMTIGKRILKKKLLCSNSKHFLKDDFFIISKKRLNESITATHTIIKTASLKSSFTNRSKKMKTIFKRLDDTERTKISSNPTISRNVSTSSSTDSVIYVGSYKLNEKYSLIDLTHSITSIKSKSFPLSKYTHFSNCHTFYTNLVGNSNLACTASTSRLLDSIESPKLSLKKNTKSASCLTLVNDKQTNQLRNCEISKGMHSLNKKEQFFTDKMVELEMEDRNMINHSLEIQDDINILDLCSPQTMMANDVSVETLMKTYRVGGTDEFLE